MDSTRQLLDELGSTLKQIESGRTISSSQGLGSGQSQRARESTTGASEISFAAGNHVTNICIQASIDCILHASLQWMPFL